MSSDCSFGLAFGDGLESRIDRDPGKIPVPVKIGLFAGIPVPVKIVKFTRIPTGILIFNFWKIQLIFLEFSDIFYEIFYT